MDDNEERNYWTASGRRRLSRRYLLAAAGAGVAVAGLAGCSTQGQKSQPAGGAVNQPGQASSGGTPQPGGTYTYYAMNNPRLDPQKESAGSQQYVSGVYSRIFRFKTGPDPKTFTDHDLENDLGVSAESPDAVTWTVKLRPDAKFHNIAPVNGHPVEAEDDEDAGCSVGPHPRRWTSSTVALHYGSQSWERGASDRNCLQSELAGKCREYGRLHTILTRLVPGLSHRMAGRGEGAMRTAGFSFRHRWSILTDRCPGN